MSYDIDLNTYSEAPVSPERLSAARAIISRYGGQPVKSFHCFSVRWDDGSGFSLHARALFDESLPFSGLLSPLGGLSRRFCDFAYEFASAIGCTISPDVIPPFVLVVHSAILTAIPETVQARSKVIQVSDGLAVHDALSKSYQGWRTLLHDTARQLNEAFAREERADEA